MLRKLAGTHGILFAALAAHGALFAHYYPKVLMDDMYINIRYAANLYHGKGLTYNIGEPFEGYSAFLFILLQAGLRYFTEDWFLIAKFLSIGFLMAFIVVFYFFARRYIDDKRALCLLMGVVAVDPVFVAAGSLGMETSMYLFVTCATVWAFMAGAGVGRFKIWPLFAVISVMTRPEGIMFVTILIVAEVLSSYESLDPGKLKSCFAKILAPEKIFIYVSVAVYFLGKYLYYGTLITGPSVAKMAFLPHSVASDSELWMVKMKALVLLGVTYGIPALPALYFGIHRWQDNRFRFLVTFTSLSVLFTIVFHGIIFVDSGYYWRYHGQVVPFVFLLAALGLNFRKAKERLRFGVLLLFGVFALMALWKGGQLVRQISKIDAAWVDYAASGRLLAGAQCDKGKEDLILATTEAGGPPFLSGLYTIDLMGLNNGVTARLIKNHDFEGLKNYVIRLRPSFFFLFTNGFIYKTFPNLLKDGYEPVYRGNGTLLLKDKNLVCRFSPPQQ